MVYILTGCHPGGFNLFSLQKKVIHGRFTEYKFIFLDILLKKYVRFVAYMTNS
jgi:hypothetical protein